LREAVRISPKLDRAWYGMGLSLRALERNEEALQAFERTAVLQPMNGFAFYEVGMTHHALGRKDKVEEVLGHLGSFDPKMANKLAHDAGLALDPAGTSTCAKSA
jgi:tetratricopeptide (TPR) repeat protein